VGGFPTGSVQFYACKASSSAGTLCQAGQELGGPVTSLTNVTSGPGAGFTVTAGSIQFNPTSVGTWCFGARFTSGGSNAANYTNSQDNFNPPANSAIDLNECFTVGPANSSTSTTASTSSIVIGTSGGVTDNVTVQGVPGGGFPQGSVQFYACKATSSSGTLCMAGQELGSPVTSFTDVTSGPGAGYTVTATSPEFDPSSTGTWCFGAKYLPPATGSNYLPSSDNFTPPDPGSPSTVNLNECFLVTQANFKVTKADVPGNGMPVTPGSTIPYTVTIQNIGDGRGQAVISDTLPSNLTLASSPAPGCTASAGDTCVVGGSGSTLTFTVNMGAGDTATATFSAVVSATDTADVVNTAHITSGPCNPDTSVCSSTVTNPVPNFTVNKTDTPGDGNSVTPGATVPYTVTVQNTGDGAGSVTVSDPLPSNLTPTGTPSCSLNTGHNTADTCSAGFSGSSLTITATLAGGDTATVHFSAIVSATDTANVVNTATITQGPCNGDNTCSSTVTNPVPNFTVTKSDVPGNGQPVAPGSTIPYTVLIHNNGGGSGTATITDTLPSNLTLASSPAPGCAATSPDTCVVGGSGSTLTFTVNLAAGHSATATFSAVVSATNTADVVNTATITNGPCNGDNTCSSTVTNPVPNFTVDKTDVPGNGQPVTPGSTIPYTVLIQNVGGGSGTATITDTLPSNLTLASSPAPACAATSPDTCVVGGSGSTLTFTVNLAAGHSATATFSAVVSATDTADVVNTATITSGPCNQPQGPTGPDNRPHSVTIQCSSTVTNPVPDFTVTKTDAPGNNTPVAPGSTIPYTVLIKNVGDAAGSATITDHLPSQLTLASSPAPACTATAPDTCTVGGSGSTLTFTVNLAAGNTATATFSALVATAATGTITNTATITTGPCNTSSGCSSSVSNPMIVAAPTTTTTTTAPPVAKPAAIAFTGADIAGMVAAALGLLGLGGFLVLLSRRRREAGESR
jgi:fimbrial isopeptide formation D2 family protein/uncharacterized repeat protein (TIGR01451 family)